MNDREQSNARTRNPLQLKKNRGTVRLCCCDDGAEKTSLKKEERQQGKKIWGNSRGGLLPPGLGPCEIMKDGAKWGEKGKAESQAFQKGEKSNRLPGVKDPLGERSKNATKLKKKKTKVHLMMPRGGC